MSRAPPWRPWPVVPSSRERGLPRRQQEMNSNPVILSSSIPLEKDEGVRDVKRNESWRRSSSYTGSEIAADLPEDTEGGKLWVWCFSFHSWHGDWLSVYLNVMHSVQHQTLFYHHVRGIMQRKTLKENRMEESVFVEIALDYWCAEHNMCMLLPVCVPSEWECVPVKTAGQEDHLLLLASVQLKRTLTLL